MDKHRIVFLAACLLLIVGAAFPYPTQVSLAQSDTPQLVLPVADPLAGLKKALENPSRGPSASYLLWEQLVSQVNTSAYVDQDFSNLPSYGTYLADDFEASIGWAVNLIFIPGGGTYKPGKSLADASLLHFLIYTDNAGVPSGYPGGGAAPLWSLDIAPGDSRISLSTGVGGLATDTTLALTAPFYLPPGHYWLVFYPEMSSITIGQYGRNPSDSSNGYTAKVINPGNGWGKGWTAWTDWTNIDPGLTQTDIAFRLEGDQALFVYLPAVMN